MEDTLKCFKKLIDVMKQLRAPGGCPWDRKQTYDSLCPHIVEEAYELVDAIERRNESGALKHVVEECGDLLLQVIFIGTIAEERKDFSIADIPEAISAKLIRRHPHIFGSAKAPTPEQALANWEAIKRQEREDQKVDTSVLSGVPRSMPPLVKAYRIQQKAASVGFDWEKHDQSGIIAKINEEFGEVKEAISGGDKEEITSEIGDLLFAVINLSRRLDIDPSEAISKTNAKFDRRFRSIEKDVDSQGKKWTDFSLDELEALWQKAKRNE